jgi:hypothetical protein
MDMVLISLELTVQFACAHWIDQDENYSAHTSRSATGMRHKWRQSKFRVICFRALSLLRRFGRRAAPKSPQPEGRRGSRQLSLVTGFIRSPQE